MKIALLGYGKMGKVIERIALERGHEIVVKKDEFNTFDGLSTADVAIDFSIPTVAFNNISNCINHQIPVISGTTGWLNDYTKAVNLCEEKQGAFIYASNFSLGVNIFFELNKNLARMMTNLNQYKVSLEEIHHTQKLDAPSGTAITLAEGIIENNDRKSKWVNENSTSDNELEIISKRIENIPGTHTVVYNSPIDEIYIRHTAHNRQGFALGAVVAAEFMKGKSGFYGMNDLLKF